MGISSSIQMPSSAREQEALSFLLFKTLPGFKEVFNEVSESTMQTGDILLFPMETCSSSSIWSFKHAAVYCGEEEVVHFQKIGSSGDRSWVIKEGYKVMKKKRGKCEIYRKKGGINLDDFRRKVREAMNNEAKYDYRRNNCIHFALFLLGLVDFYMQLVEVKNEGGSNRAAPCSPLIPVSQKSNHMV